MLLNAFKKAGRDKRRIKIHKVWQDGIHPELLITNLFLDQKLDYIHNNPVEAEIMDQPEQYRYSPARDYAAMKGFAEGGVDRLVVGLKPVAARVALSLNAR